MPPTDPSDELVDVVNSDGRVVSTVPRSVMRRERLPHRAVYVLVFNVQGHVLIHQRTFSKDIYPGYWDVCVGGVPRAGEDFDDAARRETAEEIGITAPLHSLFDIAYADESTIVQGKVYRLVHDGPFRLQAEEILHAEFVPPPVLERLRLERPFCPDGWQVWRKYRQIVSPSGGE